MLWYRAKEEHLRGWYVEFLRKDRWQVGKSKNVDREILARIFARYYEQFTA
jgi:hypothetical protein